MISLLAMSSSDPDQKPPSEHDPVSSFTHVHRRQDEAVSEDEDSIASSATSDGYGDSHLALDEVIQGADEDAESSVCGGVGGSHPGQQILEPFAHQVGGHFPMVCLDHLTLCKPLSEREHQAIRHFQAWVGEAFLRRENFTLVRSCKGAE